MEHPVPDLLGPPLVPELSPDIAAGPSRHKHLILVSVPAVGAFPDQFSALVLFDQDLAVISAAFTEIALCIQLGIHNIVIDEFHDRQHRRNVVLHIGHFHIADGAAGDSFWNSDSNFSLLKASICSVTCT